MSEPLRSWTRATHSTSPSPAGHHRRNIDKWALVNNDHRNRRADSPMRSESVILLEDGGPGHEDDPRHTTQGEDSRSTGFTAVNGHSSRSTSVRSSADVIHVATRRDPIEVRSEASPTAQTADFQAYGWRPNSQPIDGYRTQTVDEHPSDRGMRRTIGDMDLETKAGTEERPHDVGGDSDSPPQDGSTDDEAGPRRKRQMTILDSAIDLPSPSRNMPPSVNAHPSEPITVGPYQREPSPIARWNQGALPPKPRPETEASLIESARQFHQSQRAPDVRHNAGGESSSPVGSDENRHEQAELQDIDDAALETSPPNGEGAKKRKRLFSRRTKSGCHTCRQRKKKCDERKPVCNNCKRGNFPCQGYGIRGSKPQTGKGRSMIPLQAKNLELKNGATPSWTNAADPNGRPQPLRGASYPHWDRAPGANDPRTHMSQSQPPLHSRPTPQVAEAWPLPQWPSSDPRHSWGPEQRPLMVETPTPAPPRASDFTHNLAPAMSYGATLPPAPLPPPPLQPAPTFMHRDPWSHPPHDPYRPMTSAPTILSESSDGRNSHGSHVTIARTPQILRITLDDREKMLRGLPFYNWCEDLVQDRRDCRVAVDQYNGSLDPTRAISGEQMRAYFSQVLTPTKRNPLETRHNLSGSIGEHVFVEAPFSCDYGYNLHIGKEVVIHRGCYFQDAADITIGDRAVIGPNVKVHCLTASLDANRRRGSGGEVVAGAVQIEDDVFIGGEVIILAYCTIGKGAVVGAGSVVTKDVKENTVVAGNPAKRIRKLEGRNPDDGRNEDILSRNQKVIQRMSEARSRAIYFAV